MFDNTKSASASFDPERLITIRRSLGINKTEAAKRVGLSKMGYGRYENGQRIPSPQTVEFIAQCLDTTSAYLYGMTDDPTPDYILVSKDSEPELFHLVSTIRNSDHSKLSRLLHYYKSLTD